MKLPIWICHQKPERCFKLKGKPMILCSRCFGFYSFMLLGFLFSLIVRIVSNLNAKLLFIITLVLTFPFFFDSATQFFGWRESNNYLRFITGSLAGLILGIDVYYILVF